MSRAVYNDYYVYEHWRPDTDTCFYVGKGRKKRAWKLCDRNLHHVAIRSKLVALGLAIDVRIIVTNLSEEAAYLVEQDRIASYDAATLANKTGGGPGLNKASEETRKKIGTSKIGNRNMVGRKLSEGTKRKISIAHKGKPPNWDLINRLSESNRGNRWNVGKKLTAEVRRKMSAAHKGTFTGSRPAWTVEQRAAARVRALGRKMSREAVEKTMLAHRKPVMCIEDGVTFRSAMEAGKHYGLFNHAKVAEVCRGVRKTAAGRTFKYIGEAA